MSQTSVPPWASGERSSRANNFDLLRMLLALGVIVSHAWQIAYSGGDARLETGEPLYRWTGGQVTLGAVCLHGFFVISGYLIAASWVHSRGVWDYAMKRVLRIYPGYLLAFAVSWAIAGAAGAGFRPTVRGVLHEGGHAVFLQAVRVESAFAGNPLPALVNGSLWTIQYEFYCYGLIALMGGWLVRRRAGRVAVIVMVLAVLAAIMWWTQWDPYIGYFRPIFGRPQDWPRLASHFLAGTAFYLYRDRVPHQAGWAIAAIVALVAGGIVSPLLAVVSPAALAYLILWTAFHPRLRCHHFSKYGDFSYGVYLYAFPIQQALVYWKLTSTVAGNIALAMPIAVVAGTASWHLCEKRFIHFRRSGRRPDVLTAVPSEAST